MTTRLADYFVTIGAGTSLVPEDPALMAECEDPLSLSYVGQLMDRYPATNYKDTPLPPVPMFCMPRGLLLSRTMPLPTFFGFVLTGGDGERLFGMCLTIYEPLPSSVLSILRKTFGDAPSLRAQKQEVFAPKCLCLVSHWPLYSIFQRFLTQLYRISLSPSPIPAERWIVNFMNEVPLPPPGRVMVQMNVGDTILKMQRPSPNEFPLLDVPLEHLFMCLDPDNVLKLFASLLTEQKVLLHSCRLALLTHCAEAAIALLFPFVWQHVYIPLLPKKLCGFVEAPTPFLMGLHTEDMSEIQGLSQVVIVDLDNNRITYSSPLQMPRLPEKAASKLRSSIHEHGNVFEKNHPLLVSADSAFAMAPPPCDVDGDEDGLLPFHTREIREAFLRFFVAVFQNYENFLSRQPDIRNEELVFNRRLFVEDLPSDARPFAKNVLESQAFARFIMEAYQSRHTQVSSPIAGGGTFASAIQQPTPLATQFAAVRFFDDSIAAKLNRSRLTMRKHATPFLSDLTSAITKTVISLQPDATGLTGTYSHQTFELQPELYYTPRQVEALVNAESDVSRTRTSWNTALAMLKSLVDDQLQRKFISGDEDEDRERFGGTGSLLRQPEFSNVAIHTSVACPNPSCHYILVEDDVRSGWAPDPQNYTTECPKCRCRFVPRFVVHIHGGRGRSRTVQCEYLSPVTLKKEVENVLNKKVDFDLKQLHEQHPTIFWNLIVAFDKLRFSATFILPQIDWGSALASDVDMSTPTTPAILTEASSISAPESSEDPMPVALPEVVVQKEGALFLTSPTPPSSEMAIVLKSLDSPYAPGGAITEPVTPIVQPVKATPVTAHPLASEDGTPTPDDTQSSKPKGSGFRKGAYRGRPVSTKLRLSTDRIPVIATSLSSGGISVGDSPPESGSNSPISGSRHRTESSPGLSPVFEPSSPPPPQFLQKS